MVSDVRDGSSGGGRVMDERRRQADRARRRRGLHRPPPRARGSRTQGAEVHVVDGLDGQQPRPVHGHAAGQREPRPVPGDHQPALREAERGRRPAPRRGRARLPPPLPRAQRDPAAGGGAPGRDRPRRTLEQGPDVARSATRLRTLENALDWARDQAEHFVYFSSSMVYGELPQAGGDRGRAVRADRHLRRPQVRRREDGDRLQAGLRPRLHDHPALRALRTGLREPAREPDLHRERARGLQAARRRRRRRAARLLLRRRRGRRRRPRDRRPRLAQRDLQHHRGQVALAVRPDHADPGALPRGGGRVRGARRAAPVPRHAAASRRRAG